jgi:hypothetical protein
MKPVVIGSGSRNAMGVAKEMPEPWVEFADGLTAPIGSDLEKLGTR